MILAYGLPGTGKSSLLHDLVKAQSHEMLFLVVDHDASWGDDGAHWRGQPPKDIRVVNQDDEIEPDELPETGVVVFRNWSTHKVAELCIAKGFSTLVDDELDKSARRKGWEAKGDNELDSPLRRIVHEGRHLYNSQGEVCQVHMLGACRRPQNLHTDVTDIAEQIYVFRVSGSRTINRLLDDSTIPDDSEELVKQLPNFEFLHYPSNTHGAIEPVGPPKNTEQNNSTKIR